MTSGQKATGGCACGAIRFELGEMPALALNCHCSVCRRTHGAAFGSFTVVGKDNFAWTAGQDDLGVFESSPGNLRQFCTRCGSHVAILEPWNPGGVTVVIAAMDEPGELRPSAHMFCASKSKWYSITDDLPQHPGWPPGLGPA